MLNITVTPDWLVVLASAILSLGFSYIPGLNTWYAALAEEAKKLIMAGVILLLLVGVYLLQCNGVVDANLVCTSQGIMQGAVTYFLAISANQGTYKITPKTNAVKAILTLPPK